MADLRHTPPIYEFGGFRLDTGRRQLRSPRGGLATVPVKVFDILQYLVEHYGELVEKSELMAFVWPNVVVEEGNLSQGIFMLRRALGEQAGEDRFIMTVPGRGYRFVAPVTTIAAAENAAGLPPLPASKRATPRLGVLPLENLSPDPANAFFTDGLHAEILGTLASQGRGIDVISRTTMNSYRGQQPSMSDLRRELQITHVLEGSVRRDAVQVRVTLQLVDAEEDRPVWSRSFDRQLADMLALQSQIAQELLTQLSVKIIPVQAEAKRHVPHPDAYDLYLKGQLARQFLGQTSPLHKLQEVMLLADAAIRVDPLFALPYAQRAMVNVMLFAWNHDVSVKLVTRIRRDLNLALTLAPGDPLVLGADASYLHWVERDLARAQPRYAEAEAAGLADTMFMAGKTALLLGLGRTDEMTALSDRLIELDPENPFLAGIAGSNASLVGDPSRSLQMMEYALARQDARSSRTWLERWKAALLFAYRGESAAWRACVDQHGDVSEEKFLDQHLPLLRLERRFDEAQHRLFHFQSRVHRVVPSMIVAGPSFFGTGSRPLAEAQGWIALLQKDASSAARFGAEVLEFATRESPQPWNSWYLKLLAASGHCQCGQRPEAARLAREVLADVSTTTDAWRLAVAGTGVAWVLAWSEAEEDAIRLLDTLSSSTPCLPPGWIVHDPLINEPLSSQPGYQALAQRLRQKMLEQGFH